MPAPLVSEDEFLELWEKHGSVAKLAKVLGTSERAILRRRKRLEAVRGLTLGVKNGVVHKHSSSAEMQIKDGVVIVFSDAHYQPGPATTAHRAVVRFIKQMKPVAVVCNGDAFDGARLSRFPTASWIDHDKRPTVLDELEACKTRLGEIEKAAKGAKLFWPLGNHDARYEARLANMVPDFGGISGFHLKDHFPLWIPCWSAWFNGHTVCKHRWKGGIHATHNNTVQSGTSIITGHLHSLKVTPWTDYTGTRYGVDTGTLSDPDGDHFDYCEGSPKNWRSGFVVLTFKDYELLWPEVVYVTGENTVGFRGQIIEV